MTRMIIDRWIDGCIVGSFEWHTFVSNVEHTFTCQHWLCCNRPTRMMTTIMCRNMLSFIEFREVEITTIERCRYLHLHNDVHVSYCTTFGIMLPVEVLHQRYPVVFMLQTHLAIHGCRLNGKQRSTGWGRRRCGN